MEVLAPDKYREFHLSGAINVALSGDFERQIQEELPDRSRPIMVYCYDQACTASPKAAQKMDHLGYRQVYDCEAGKMDWKDASLPVEAGSA